MGLAMLPLIYLHEGLIVARVPNLPNLDTLFMLMSIWLLLSILIVIYRYLLVRKLETYRAATGDLIALELVQRDFHEALRLKIAEKMPQLSVEKAADTGGKSRVSIFRYRFLTEEGREELLFQPIGFEWKKPDFANLPHKTLILYDHKNARKHFAPNFISFGRPTGFSEGGEIQFDERAALLHWLLALLIGCTAFLLAYNKMFPFF